VNKYLTDPYRIMADHARTDVTDIIRQVLVSPIKKEGVVREPDGHISMEELSRSNTTVQTRIITQLAYNAIQGDVKSAEFLMKYGGYAAPEREMAVDMPIIVDDVTNRLEPIPPSRLALEAAEAAAIDVTPATIETTLDNGSEEKDAIVSLDPACIMGGVVELRSDL